MAACAAVLSALCMAVVWLISNRLPVWMGAEAEVAPLASDYLRIVALGFIPNYMGVVLALACVLPFITIFLFKRRLLQIRLCVVEIVLLIGSAVMEAAYYFLSWRVFSELSFHTQGFRPAIALPLVCLLFAYLAARAVFRDELMVRAADRIR